MDVGLIKFNIGGIIYETKRDTLKFDTSCRLSDDSFLSPYYIQERKEYFFDRDATMFSTVLNYLRSGELHLPTNVCSAAARMELTFWGIQTEKIEMCCMSKYSEWNSALKAVVRMEKERKRKEANDAKVTVDGSTKTWKVIKQHTWHFLTRPRSSTAAQVFGYVSLIFAILSIVSFFAATTEPFQYVTHGVAATDVTNSLINYSNTENKAHDISKNASLDALDKGVTIVGTHPLLQAIDIVCLAYFTLEYLARFAVSPSRFKQITSILGVVDFLALLPDYVEIVASAVDTDDAYAMIAFNFGTVLRVLRVLRIFRLVRHSMGVWILIYTLRSSFKELMLLIWLLAICVMFFSSLIFFAEGRDNFKSIPDAFWWAIITMTTVGYGDMYPVTIFGKMIGSLCAMCGVLVIGFTVPTLVNNFILFYSQMKAIEHFRKLSKEAKERKGEKMCNGGSSVSFETDTLVDDDL